MNLKGVRVGVAMTGSFCTLKTTMEEVARLKEEGVVITPIMSETLYNTDTRFGKAKDFINQFEEIAGTKVLSTIKEVEPIGPEGLLDILIIIPCTGNTLSKMALGVTDSSVTMAAKAHVRNGRPLLIGIATNDGLAANAKNLGLMLNAKNVYFIPFNQDDASGKPTSIIADMSSLIPASVSALSGVQLQPVIYQKST